jgi:hypothetical protein
VYYDLNEIAMGAPIGGECRLETADKKTIKIHDWCLAREIRSAAHPYAQLRTYGRIEMGLPATSSNLLVVYSLYECKFHHTSLY